MISIERLTYCYPHQKVAALDDVSLRIEPGEFVLLTGQSGSGKSTLLRSLSGLVPHFSGGTIAGRVQVDGHDPMHEGPQQLSKVVGLVFQNPEAQAVLDEVEAEIAFGLENAGIARQEMRIRIEEVLNLLELVPLRHRPLHTLSGGERQRVTIAAALALRPQILALDEPTSQLDPQSAADVLSALVRLNEDLGLTIVLAEHRLERVLRHVERVIVMKDGKVMADGSTPAVLEEMPQLPPLARLGRILDWRPLPLTVKEGRRFANGLAAQTEGGAARNGQGDARNEPILFAEDLHYAYGQRPALRGVTLSVNSGEALVVMGRNGSGKTTLLRCLVGLLQPREGDVRLSGRSVKSLGVAQISRQVAYLPQAPDDLLFAETVRQELMTTLHNHGLNGAEDSTDPLLSELGLLEQAGAYPRDLAVGQRQRTALGALMVTRPSLLLLDEPTRGLDYEAKRALVSLWRRWQKNGLGLLMVTHDVELAAQVADRVVILSEGEVIADGAAREVLTGSPLFAPQMARLFPDRQWLTVEDVLMGLGLMPDTDGDAAASRKREEVVCHD